MMNRLVHSCLALIMTASVLGCSSTPVAPPRTSEMNANLTEQEARQRFAQISDVKYELSFDLTQDKAYTGVSRITFKTVHTDSDLRVDFHQGRPGQIKVPSLRGVLVTNR